MRAASSVVRELAYGVNDTKDEKRGEAIDELGKCVSRALWLLNVCD